MGSGLVDQLAGEIIFAVGKYTVVIDQFGSLGVLHLCRCWGTINTFYLVGLICDSDKELWLLQLMCWLFPD